VWKEGLDTGKIPFFTFLIFPKTLTEVLAVTKLFIVHIQPSPPLYTLSHITHSRMAQHKCPIVSWNVFELVRECTSSNNKGELALLSNLQEMFQKSWLLFSAADRFSHQRFCEMMDVAN
jgi:hypothetical protein